MAPDRQPSSFLLGQTRTETAQVRRLDGTLTAVSLCRAINVATDPQLARRLVDARPGHELHRLEGDHAPPPGLWTSVLYHDPAAELLVLVLPEHDRPRELQARAELLGAMAASAGSIPSYADRYETVFGAAGLRTLLAARDERAAREHRLDQLERELREREQAVTERERELDERSAALNRLTAAAVRKVPPSASPAPAPAAGDESGAVNGVSAPAEDDVADFQSSGDAVSSITPSGTEVELRVEDLTLQHDVDSGSVDGALARWIRGRDTVLAGVAADGSARLAVIAGSDAERRALRADPLQVKLQLHRLPGAALPTLAFGPAGSFEDARRADDVWVHAFDLSASAVREMFAVLARDFRLTLDLYDAQRRPVARRVISTDLADNVAVLLRAADDHRASLPAGQRSFARALQAFEDSDYDRLALRHPERPSFRDDKLRALGRPSAVLAALSIARRFSKPEREDYVVLTRGYSVRRWHQRRKRVITRAIELGLWIGPRLAHIAISEGLVPSKQQLIRTLMKNFGELEDSAHGLDDSAVRTNWSGLREQADALGLASGDPIHSEVEPAVSGVISRDQPAEATDVRRPASADDDEVDAELRARLSSKDQRLDAALAIISGGHVSELDALFEAVDQMTRSEAGQVLGAVPSLGRAAVPALRARLSSHKGFVRQGCALALGVIGGEDAVEVLAELVVSEPTDIWREVARALGMIGAPAVAPLVVQARQQPDGLDRVALALANVMVHGGAKVVESLARGRDPVAADVGARAKHLIEQARRDDAAVRSTTERRDVTVNRAFSRRFFEAMNAAAAPLGAVEGDVSAPAMALDEADLLDAIDLEDEAQLLDDSDLLPG